MRITKTFLKYSDWLSEWTGKGIAWLTLVLVGVLVYETIMRYVFSKSTVWAYDASYMLGGCLYVVAAAYTLKARGHVRVDVFYRRYPAWGKGLVDTLFALLFFFPALGLLLYYSTESTMLSWQIKETVMESHLRPPIYPLRTVLSIALLLLLLQGIAEFIRSLFLMTKGREP